MRVLFTTQPALGHLHPLVPLARAMTSAGHEVSIAASPSFCAYVSQLRFEAIPTGLDWLESRAEERFADVLGPPTHWGPETPFTDAFRASSRSLLGGLREVIATRQIDLVVHESTEFAAVFAAEFERVPAVAVGIGHGGPVFALESRTRALWDHARGVLGLPPDPECKRLFEHLYLDLHPRSLHAQPPEKTIPASRPIRPELVEPLTPPLASLNALGERDVAYVTLGTVFNRADGVFDKLVRSLSGFGLDLVVTTGDTIDPQDLARSDDVVVLERFIPDAHVLSKADLVVCHAGYNTMIAALRYGLPMLCVPLGADQHYNAFRAASAGAAVVLDRDADESEIRTAVVEVRSNPIYRANARRLQAEIEAMPHVSTAVSLLEHLVGGPARRRADPGDRGRPGERVMTSASDEPLVRRKDATAQDAAAVRWAVSSGHRHRPAIVTRGLGHGRALKEIREDWERAGRPPPERPVHRDAVRLPDGSAVTAVPCIADDATRHRRSFLTSILPAFATRGSTAARARPIRANGCRP